MVKNRKKFKNSILVLLFLILIIVSSFLFVSNSISDLAFEQSCSANLEVLKQTKTPIKTLVDDTNFVSESILGNTGVVDMMRVAADPYGQTEFNQYRLGFTFSSLFSSRDYLDSISVYNDRGILLQFGSLVTQEDMSRAEEISNLKGKAMWTAAEHYLYPIYGKQGEPVVSLYRALNDLYAMDQLGYQRISIKEKEIYQRYSAAVEENIRVFIVNSTGDVVSSDDKGLLEKNLSARPYFARLSEKEEGYFVREGDVYSYYHIENPDWCVVQVTPREMLMGSARAITNTLMLCMLLCIAFVTVFFWWQIKAVQVEQGYKSKLLKREMELKYLQGQINPHFLYNTLDTIRWMAVKSGETSIAAQVKALSEIFRHTLNKGMDFTTVAREVEHVDKYMLIQQNRFGDRIDYEVQVEEDCLSLKVPNLVLQPLVENAVVHGLEDIVEKGKITVMIYREGDTLYYVVSDNGTGFVPEEIVAKMQDEEAQHEVFALKNIDERLKLLYGEEYGLTLISVPGEGSRIIVKQKIDR